MPVVIAAPTTGANSMDLHVASLWVGQASVFSELSAAKQCTQKSLLAAGFRKIRVIRDLYIIGQARVSEKSVAICVLCAKIILSVKIGQTNIFSYLTGI